MLKAGWRCRVTAVCLMERVEICPCWDLLESRKDSFSYSSLHNKSHFFYLRRIKHPDVALNVKASWCNISTCWSQSFNALLPIVITI